MTNRNTLWAQVFVDELARTGLRYVVLAPGSRNTPLTLAFAQHPTIKAFSHLDERSGAFFALGLARASHQPAAIVCTSGTALANFYPAIVEAHQAQIPLLVLSGDRPHELRHSGANQTIDQIKIYGDMVRWFVDVALPESAPTPLSLRNLRTLAGRAIAVAKGMPRGVVHLNFPFQAPLEPTPVEKDSQTAPNGATAREEFAPYTTVISARPMVPPEILNWLAEVVSTHERGLIVCGSNDSTDDWHQSLLDFAECSSYPILVDVLSNLRFYENNHLVLGGYDGYLEAIQSPPPDVVIRFGKLPTSKPLNRFLTSMSCQTYIHIAPDVVWADDAHRISHFIPSDFQFLLGGLNARLEKRPQSAWAQTLYEIETMTWQRVASSIPKDTLSEVGTVRDVLELLPAESLLFIGNSLPIRHADQFGQPQAKNLHIYANRGASGIDGVVSTALGIGAALPERPLTLIIGDVSFYHDMNGLLAINRLNIPITIVLLNNNGGGIFRRLPVRNFEPEFTEWFITAHDLPFEHVAHLYSLDYHCVDTSAQFREVFSQSVQTRGKTLIEVQTSSEDEETLRQSILNAIRHH